MPEAPRPPDVVLDMCSECRWLWLAASLDASHRSGCSRTGMKPDAYYNPETGRLETVYGPPEQEVTVPVPRPVGEVGMDGGPFVVVIREARDLEVGDILLQTDRGELMPWNILGIGVGRCAPFNIAEDGEPVEQLIEWWNVELERQGAHGRPVRIECEIPAFRPCLVLVTANRHPQLLVLPADGSDVPF